ncbi:MAG: HAMP domain-containing histidine kinase, partial [Oscillospiraceae bacterium]|nr:HAMP domain-containing histidine kinase [Oscillospiraceae bacterium]
YWILAILVAAFVSLILSFVFLMCAAGRRKGKSEVQSGWGTKIPFDLLTVAAAFGVYTCIALGTESTYYWEPFLLLIIPLLYVIGVSITLGWCMSLALRLKLGRFWKDTVICWGLGFIWRALRAIFRGIGKMLSAIPLAPACVLIFGAVFAAELFVMLGVNYVGELALWWVLERIVLFGAMLYLVLCLYKLERGGEAIAAGDLSYQVDTRGMPAHFRRHGENLNRIGEGMTAAVEERMRSERMKTELITNVSHDIKTPLTSIINYADLIAREKCENETVTEYAAVLHRQSERLKRLIEDLVEASKASSGSIEVNLQPCEAGVFLTQAAGEYALRLQESSLQLITDQPPQSIYILADGRRLWRVLDNLMNNACKYAQSGTRVYLTLSQEGQQAVITLKNISRDALNIPPEELMERFVRADASRRSEGSGLGLSIARSLTELQGGTMELNVDGDLFKVTLRFPVMQ